METLKSYFLYEKNTDGVSEIYENLSRQLKAVHARETVVANMNSDEIVLDETPAFHPEMPFNYPVEKRYNIKALAKMMIGTYLSLGTGFKDFSSVDDSWFIDNLDTIFDTIHEENFDKEYFASVFLEGKDDYYSDYLDRKRQAAALQGKSNEKGFVKELKTAASALYEDLSNQEENTNEKTAANMQIAFNPLLIGISLAIVSILFIMLALVN